MIAGAGGRGGGAPRPVPPGPQPASRLDRRLGVGDAVAVGLGAMLGTGVFVVFAPAAAAAGWWLLAGLLVAAVVAYANAMSSAGLAAQHPESGGTYAYGRVRLGRGWGTLAGYAFLLGKVASCGAAALAVGAYTWPAQQRLLGTLVVVAVTALNFGGVAKTVGVTKVLVAVLLGVLALVVVAGFTSGGGAAPGASAEIADLADPADSADPARAGAGGPTGALPAAALLFFAFTGYARIATLGEEVRDPARTIPRAVPLALGAALATYLLVGLAALLALGPDRLATAEAPLAEVVAARGWDVLVPIVRAGGAVAALSVLVSLAAGVSRTTFAMARGGDLPRWLGAVHGRHGVPHRAVLAVGGTVLVVVLTGGILGAVAFSAFTVLVYYAVANAAAVRLTPGERIVSPVLPMLGLAGCVLLAFSLPPGAVAAGTAALAGCVAAAYVVRRSRGV